MIIFHPTSVLDHSMGDLDVVAYSCIENRESGDWYIEATFPIDSPIVKDTIIVVPTKDSNKQPFRVEEITSTNVIEVKAYHIGFDLKRYGVELSTTISGSCQAALNELKFQAYDTVPFTFTTDIVGNQTFSIIDTDVYSGLLDIADRYNGKVVFDWMTVSIQSSIGADRGMVLEYGKNIRENEVNEDWSKVVTKLKPIGTEGITLTPEWLIADVQYSKPYTKIMQFDSDEASNLALVAQLYLDRYKIPRVNYKVKGNPSFMASGFPYLSLFTYEELESFTFEELENINEQYYFELGDLILVKARQFQVLTEVIQYRYNVMSGYVESVEFGNYRPTVKNAVEERFDPIVENLGKTQLRIDESNRKISLITKDLENYSTIEQTTTAISLSIGELQVGGINLMPQTQGQWESGGYDINTGVTFVATDRIRTLSTFAVIPDQVYTYQRFQPDMVAFALFYNSSNTFLSAVTIDGTKTLLSPATASYVRFVARWNNFANFPLSDIQYLRFKMEKGNKPTDYSFATNELKSAKYVFDNSKARFYGDGQEWYDNSGNLKVSFDTVNDRFKFEGDITALTGSIGRFSVTDDDLVYTSDLFNYPYDYADLVRLRGILAGLMTPTPYDLAIYDINKDGILNVLDSAQLSLLLDGSTTVTPRQVRSVTRIGTTSGGFTTQFLGDNGSAGPITTVRGNKIFTSALTLPQGTIIGGIVESGSNANGSYTKYSDGTMVCRHTTSINATFSAWGSIFSYDHTTLISFPENFISPPVLTVTGTGNNASWVARANASTSGITFLTLARPTSLNLDYSFHYIAIGRWK